MVRQYKTFILCMLLLSVFTLQFIEAKTVSLKGKVIILDIGHGGRDSGTWYGDIYEKDINLEISKVLKNVLEEAGATVYMTREKDEDLSSKWDTLKKRGDLYRRILFIQEKNSDLYLSIHINWFDNPSHKGQEVLYNSINPKNKILGSAIMKEFKKDFNTTRELTTTDLYLYRNTRVPGVLIECGFLSNPEERRLLQEKSYQNKLSNSIKNGVINYMLKIST